MNSLRGECGREGRLGAGRNSGAARRVRWCRKLCSKLRKRGRQRHCRDENPNGYPDGPPLDRKCTDQPARVATAPRRFEIVGSRSAAHPSQGEAIITQTPTRQAEQTASGGTLSPVPPGIYRFLARVEAAPRRLYNQVACRRIGQRRDATRAPSQGRSGGRPNAASPSFSPSTGKTLPTPNSEEAKEPIASSSVAEIQQVLV